MSTVLLSRKRKQVINSSVGGVPGGVPGGRGVFKKNRVSLSSSVVVKAGGESKEEEEYVVDDCSCECCLSKYRLLKN